MSIDEHAEKRAGNQPENGPKLWLGGPVWSCRDWGGVLWPSSTRPAEHLAHYARVFNAVEGNTTFYALPRLDIADRWRDQTPPGFRFLCKVPRTITHDRMLVGAERQLDELLAVLDRLGDRTGPTMIQLPPAFGPRELPQLARFVERLPRERQFAVEPRHLGFFGNAAPHRDLEALLRERGLDRVVFDTTVLHASKDDDPAVRAARSRKPRLPVLEVATASHPIVRILVVSNPRESEATFARWAARAARWIAEGRTPMLFVHTPDDRAVPWLAAELHRRIAALVDVGPLPAFVGAPPPEQISLFGR